MVNFFQFCQNKLQRFRAHSGQSLVEFTVMASLLTLLLLGVLDLGRAYFMYIALQDSSSEAAGYLSQFPNDLTNAAARARASAPGSMVDWSTACVGVSVTSTTIAQGYLISATVTGDHQLVTPFVSIMFGNSSQSIKLRAVTVMAITSYSVTTPSGNQLASYNINGTNTYGADCP